MPAYLPCLIIVFNHKFDRNIEVLEKLYEPRFKHIYFLVPFYTGSNPRVIPVYESSYYFQSYFAQGYKAFYRPEFTHYLFVGDDLILNPAINEHNYAQLLHLDETTSYLPDLVPLHSSTLTMTVDDPYAVEEPAPRAAAADMAKDNRGAYWIHTHRGINFYGNRDGSEAKVELPPKEEMLRRMAEYNLESRPLSYFNVFGPLTFPASIREALETSRKLWTYYVTWRRFKVPGHPQQLQLEYPLVYSYSDIAVVAAPSIEKFCHLCGVFGAMGLFVEMAVPTALLLSGGRILTDADAPLRGRALWHWTGAVDALEKKYSLDLNALLSDFPARQLYYHPIKLSRWRLNK
jgi:hypothetical protein